MCDLPCVCRYGVKSEFRRLFIPMMDYLQLLVVKSAFSTLKDAVFHLWNFMAGLVSNILEKLGLQDQADHHLNHLKTVDETEELMRHRGIDRESWKKMKRVGKDVLVSMNKWGISPRV